VTAGSGEPGEAPPPTVPPTVGEIAAYVGTLLGAARYPPGEHGVFVASDRPVRRLGLALDADPTLAARMREGAAVDGLWLHRPWKLSPAEIPPTLGVWFTHLPFDDRLTTSLNPRLATALTCTEVEPYGVKEGRTIGMLARTAPRPFAELRRTVAAAFGGLDEWIDPADDTNDVRRVAVVSAMTNDLVAGAAARGAALYVTGQLRPAALAAARAAGLAVAAVGHRRAERWGLRALGALVRERWAGVEIVEVA
jgi:putative NIF3 family GTP cyclohydrolase 1 type 2